jgi:hypothetical protein
VKANVIANNCPQLMLLDCTNQSHFGAWKFDKVGGRGHLSVCRQESRLSHAHKRDVCPAASYLYH